jgi:FKBP-type peptidyl-prolyl cis-trans isomerase
MKMKTITLAVTFYLGVGCLAGCASNSKPVAKPVVTTAQTPTNKMPAGTNVLGDEKARVSYAIGMTIGHNSQADGFEMDTDMLVRGFKDTQSGGTTLLTPQEMHDTLAEFQKTLAAKQQKAREDAGVKNKAEGEAFLAKNKTEPGVVTLLDGLQYKVITNGNGAIPAPTDEVTVHYRGTYIDGTEFDNSYKRGIPRHFTLGNAILPGWTEALMRMKVGSKWRLFLPPELAYGERGRPGIQPNSVLIFELELVSTFHRAPPPPIGLDQANPPQTSDIIKVPSLEEMKNGAKIEVIKPEEAAKLQPSKTQPPPTNQPAK